MKKSLTIGLLILTLFLITNSASALRCGNELVLVGDSKYEVLSRCGQPVHKEFLGVQESKKFRRRTKSGSDVKVEVWIYTAKQLGSTSYDQQLIFVGLDLVEIRHISPH